MLRLIYIILLNSLGFNNDHNNPIRLHKLNDKPLINQTVLMRGILIILLLLFVVFCFTFVPTDEAGLMRNTINNI